MMPDRARPLAAAAARHAFLLLVAAFTLAPFLIMLSTSLRTPDAIYQPGGFLDRQGFAGLANYAAALRETDVLRYMMNGLLVVSLIVAAQLAVCLPAAYALRFQHIPGRRLALALLVAALAVPHQALYIPVFLLVAYAGLIDSYWALVLPAAGSVFGVLLFYRALSAVPPSLIDAARLEGLGESAILLRIVVPLARPAIAAFVLFSVVLHWNDYIWPLVVLMTPEKFTPAVGIVFFSTHDAGTDYGPLMAAAVLVAAPLVLLFLCMQDFVLRSFTRAMTGKPQ